jgi:hypothetical protein
MRQAKARAESSLASKILLFLSFHTIHQNVIKIHNLSFLSIADLEPAKTLTQSTGLPTCDIATYPGRLNLGATKFQVASVKLHSVRIWLVVSCKHEQREQMRLQGQFLMIMLSVVNTLLCSTNQAKKIASGLCPSPPNIYGWNSLSCTQKLVFIGRCY